MEDGDRKATVMAGECHTVQMNRPISVQTIAGNNANTVNVGNIIDTTQV